LKHILGNDIFRNGLRFWRWGVCGLGLGEGFCSGLGKKPENAAESRRSGAGCVGLLL